MKRKHTNILIIIFVVLGISCVIFGIFAPYIYTHINDKVLKPNEIGDTYGGTMGPFIAIGGVIFTFLAFYMQKVANDDIKEQFAIQKLESQFYEMLRLHKENVNEINVIAKDINVNINETENINVSGKLSFLKIDLHGVQNISTNNLRIYNGREAFRIMKNEFEIYYSEAKSIKLNEIDEYDFHAAYELFFWGVKGYSRQDKRKLWQKIKPNTFIHELQEKILAIINTNNSNDPLNIFFNHETLDEVILGNGYSAHLGHYYRHLYHTVKFIADDEVLTYERKRNYLKILRGQLSNYEQIMLFYNWMGSYGDQWEDSKNNYFTKYKMIHNLWYNELNLDEFLKQKLFCLVKKYEKLKSEDCEMKQLEEGKSLFESKDDIILSFNIEEIKCR